MMGLLWVVLFVALAGPQLGYGFPLRSTPQVYPHDTSEASVFDGWGSESGLYAAVPALALVLTAVGLLFGCTWCYRHKDCKLFSASATHLHDARRSQPPDSGFSEPVNNNISEDNNNGPISLREMQNIANNNAAAYIVSENEERNRVSRESVVEFEPLPSGIRVADPLEPHVDWFGGEDFPRNRLQYLREIARGWFGRVVETDMEEEEATATVAVKILNQNASLEDKARFLNETRVYRDMRHENILGLVGRCIQEDPWILIFELCSMDLRQYLIENRPKMAILHEGGVPLRLMCDVTAALAYLHSRGYYLVTGPLCSDNVLVRDGAENARAVLGNYVVADIQHEFTAPETRRYPPMHTASSEVWSLGTLIWEVCMWGASVSLQLPPPPPDLPCPYRNHLYQVMQLCWNPNAETRPTAAQVHALINHLSMNHSTHAHFDAPSHDGFGSSDFEERWQRLKPNSIPKVDEHVAIVHAPSTSMTSHFTGSDQELDNLQTIHDTLSVDMDTAVSRSSSIMSDKEPLSVQIKSESLNNLHGSLEDVRNIYLTHNELAVLDCHQGNIALDDRDKDNSDSSVDPWLKDIIAGSQDDVSYYRDVSDVIKNLDNILNSEKTSSSESSHQASPSRDNLSLDCKKDYPLQSSMVKSPGISNFQNVLEMGFDTSDENEFCEDEEVDRETIGTLSHSYERHSDTASQHTLENLTPDTPIKDIDVFHKVPSVEEEFEKDFSDKVIESLQIESPNENKVDSSDSIPKLKESCVASMSSVSDTKEKSIVREACNTQCDSNLTKTVRTDNEEVETKSIDNTTNQYTDDKINLTVSAPVREVEETNMIMKSGVSDIVDNAEHNTTNQYTDDKTNLNVSAPVREVEETNMIINSAVSAILDDMEPKIHSVKEPHIIEDIILSKLVSEVAANKIATDVSPIEETNVILKPQISDILNVVEPKIHSVKEPHIEEDIIIPKLVSEVAANEVESNVVSPEVETNVLVKSEVSDILDDGKPKIHRVKEPHIVEDITLPKIASEGAANAVESNVAYPVVETNVVSDILDDVKPKIQSVKEPHIIEDKIIPKFESEIASNQVETDLVSPVHQNMSRNVQESDIVSLKSEACFQDEILPPISIETISNDPQATVQLNYFIPPIAVITNHSTTPTNEVINEEKDKFAINSSFQEEERMNANHLNQSCEDPKSNETPKSIEILDEVVPSPLHTSVLVQNNDEKLIEFPQNTEIENNKSCNNEEYEEVPTTSLLPPEEVQNIANENKYATETKVSENNFNETVKEDGNDTLRSDIDNLASEQEQSNNSTVYMDLINGTNSEIIKIEPIDNNVKDAIKLHLDKSGNDSACSLFENESTVYLDLPSVLKEVDEFLHSERVNSARNAELTGKVSSSTPKSSDSFVDSNLENSIKQDETLQSETNVPEGSLTKQEQKYVPDSLSPLESPTKSHHTDTYDENSSVVLGPFENCTIDYKGVKSTDLIDLPKEELLAFSSNFSDINLETPSPLRDGNFLNEVPDIVHDDLQFDDISEVKPERSEPHTDNTDETDPSGTAKHVSPSTPPNSPGIFLASTSQQKYLVDIDLDHPETVQSYPPIDTDSGLSSLQKEIDLNQIELTTKLAMAENENNMNIEYSGPLTVEGLVSEDDVVLRESDAIPESVLASNGGSLDVHEGEGEVFTMDEECMKALRNELELKLPLAQVAAIEPACENEWSELPPPPELIVSYCGAGALSPIAEETRHQLNAYENDAWNTSTRTESSESYPEPCNNSTDEVTDLPTGTGAPSGSNDHSTYTLHSKQLNDTYTIQKDIPSSKEMTMSADSLNGSPYKKTNETQSPIDDKTYNKNEEEKESNCERISQVSPFIMSPTTDTSVPVDSENIDNATGVSTLSRTTVPTDAKLSKPSECLSKATSIDSWCSNDTLYNVEENFDDLAMDPDVTLDIEPDKEEKEDKSGSTDTLTHNDDEKEISHCSTYIVHDTKSDACETFSPDSITANDNFTFTKAKTEAAGITEGKSEVNDSAKNTQTKDLAYGTLPSCSNCSTEFLSGIDDPWKLPQPELIRRTPIEDEIKMTPPRFVENEEEVDNDSPQIVDRSVKKMDSVDISCLLDDLINSTENKTESSESQGLLIDIDESPRINYNRNMAPSSTSTPLAEPAVDENNIEPIPSIQLQGIESPEYIMNNIPNFQTFQQSMEIRPQDVSSVNIEHASTNQDTDLLLEGENRTVSKNSNRDSLLALERTPTYSDFENSAASKPQEVHSSDKSSQSLECGMSSGDFRHFESSVRNRPQDLSSMIDASALLLTSERKSSELINGSSRNIDFDHTSQFDSRLNDNKLQTVDVSPSSITNLNESHEIANNMNQSLNFFVSTLDSEEETEQPHSIIITEIPKVIFIGPDISGDSKVATDISNDVSKGNSNITYDSHTEHPLNRTYDSHMELLDNKEDIAEVQPIVNGIGIEQIEEAEIKSPKIEDTETIEKHGVKATQNHINNIPNRPLVEGLHVIDTAGVMKCNGNSENYATVQFLNETFEELIESNVDENDSKDAKNVTDELLPNQEKCEDKLSNNEEIVETADHNKSAVPSNETVPQNDTQGEESEINGAVEEDKMVLVTENFLENEKNYCEIDCYLPILSDIRFTGPATEIMSTSFSQDSPTEPNSPECEQDSKPNTAAEILKDWDSDSESHSSNSSSGEFIWKQRGSGSGASGPDNSRAADGGASDGSGASGDSASGSEGDEVEFVPSSWDCRAAPGKSSLRSLEQTPPDSKKRVVFKRQKYHCVYEYPREVADVDTHSPAAYMPDFSTYCEWDPSNAEDAELGYGQLFGGSPLDLYPLRAGIAFGADFDEDFFISSSARPFESLGIMSTTSQFFPGMHVKPSALLERDLSDDVADEFPPPPSPLPPTTLVQTRMPSLDFTTPDSGVEDITPGSTSTDEDFKTKKLPENDVSQCWRPVDSGSSSESVSPSSPGGEALGGLRHTRDKLKLDLPPSPHIPSPRHNRVFNFVLDKPKRHRVPDEKPAEVGTTPLVMTDETPLITTSLPLLKDSEDVTVPEPTFSTFGKDVQKNSDSEQKIILTDDQDETTNEVKVESPVKTVETVKGEGTVLDSGDEDSGIESSSKATLERNKTPNVS